VHRADNPELTKRYFRERPGERRTHIHVRRAGSFSEQFALLFREYLRAHREHAAKYAASSRSPKGSPSPDSGTTMLRRRYPSSGTQSTSPTSGHNGPAGNRRRQTAEHTAPTVREDIDLNACVNALDNYGKLRGSPRGDYPEMCSN
jgi:GrpB protein